ncbi:MAG: hypothetical protein LUE93_08185 [Bacteroides sp.]|nr:hypothetical protein [Bacteroides sp.]
MKRRLLLILINFLSLSVSVLLYNYLTMARGYIWYNLVGPPLRNYTIEWYNEAVPLALIGSAVLALAISLLDGLVCRRYLPKLLSGVVYFICYTVAWIYISWLASESYIVNFGNTWYYTEILWEIVFVVPFYGCMDGCELGDNLLLIYSL